MLNDIKESASLSLGAFMIDLKLKSVDKIFLLDQAYSCVSLFIHHEINVYQQH
jgi:hypothetical protein